MTEPYSVWCDLDTSIPEWIIEHPETTAVFGRLHMDISCGGKSLRYVCQQNDLSPAAVLEQLHAAIARPASS
ncbi:DUF542 domain-containing protein [Allorhodopirellula solitaria]|uniref:Uncharacterized protein n=1 Tax=Allorhodopirellula solitaria TaxID=2527987 RepID=A0A5C5YF37_9BACT|nr:DUF542 domain-containing protein [Allorhodopirellula solitaria]TWT74337.1 hypothetical protein CA85_12250 [Allorhodopirellula solitaria]